MKKIIFLLSLSFVALSGCTSAPTSVELNNPDYGIAPPTSQVEEVFINSFKPTLLDPSSIQTRNIQQPKQFWIKTRNGFDAFWVICGELNGKNKFGGYVGFKPKIAWYKNGKSGVMETGPEGCLHVPYKKEADICGFTKNMLFLDQCH